MNKGCVITVLCSAIMIMTIACPDDEVSLTIKLIDVEWRIYASVN